MPPDRPSIINRETLIPIGVAFAIVGPIGVGISWLRDGQRDNTYAIQKLRDDMTVRFDTLESQSQERWTLWQQQLWAAKLKRDNPTMNVPEVTR